MVVVGFVGFVGSLPSALVFPLVACQPSLQTNIKPSKPYHHLRLRLRRAVVLGLEDVIAKDAKSLTWRSWLKIAIGLKIKNRDFKRKEPVEFRQSRR